MNKFLKKNVNYQQGLATLEMLIAMTLVVLAISATLPLVSGGQSTLVDSQTNQDALYKAQNLLEEARANAKLDFNLVNPIDPTIDDIYQKSLLVEQAGLFTKKVSSNLNWTNGVRSLSVELTTLLTDPTAVGGGNTCNSSLSGNWTNPQKAEYEFGAGILGDTSSGFPITSIQSFNYKMYVTVDNKNGNNDETFFVLDITNPAITPVLLGKIDNNPSPLVGRGLNDVAVDGNAYAYVASAHPANFLTCSNPNGTNKSCAQLQVINTSVSPLSVVYSYKIPGVTGSGDVGNRVFYKNGLVYLGLAKSTGPEFHVIDVGGGGTPGASPTSPQLMGSYEINNGINDIQVRGNYAYIASPNDEELKILDVSNPSSPQLVGSHNAIGGGIPFYGHGKSLYLVGNTLYLGRTLLNGGGDEFHILNNMNPETSLPRLGSKNIQNGGSNTSVNGVLVRDNLAFLITNEEFQIWKIDDPNNITQYASPLTLPPGPGGGLKGTAADCEGNYIYVGSQSFNDKGYISAITSGP